MGALRTIFRTIGGLYLVAVLVVGIGGTWLQYRIKSLDSGAASADRESRRAEESRRQAAQRERSSRSYAREEESEVRQAERESMGCDPSYGEC